MSQDLNSLLKKIQDLNQLADQPGGITLPQLEEEVRKITYAVKETMTNMKKQLPPELAGASGMLIDVFKLQLGAIIEKSGLSLEQTEKMKKLANELELIKRSYISS